jgi:hypothetical protein
MSIPNKPAEGFVIGKTLGRLIRRVTFALFSPVCYTVTFTGLEEDLLF